MDMSNWRPTEVGSGDVGDSSMESSDWRAQLQAGSRKRMVNKILDAMKSHVQVSGDKRLQKFEKIAVSFEVKVYIAATSQSDYMRKICFKILTIETRSDPDWQEELCEDWQEEVYEKIKAMKNLYLVDLNNYYQKVFRKLQQYDSLPQQPNNERHEKLRFFKNLLERFMAFLQVPKHKIPTSYRDKLSTYEKQIVHIITSTRRTPATTQPPPHMHYVQLNIRGSMQLTSTKNLMVLTNKPKAEDWQEEIYLKIKALKDLYLLELNDVHQNVLGKLQQYDSLPLQSNNEQHVKLKCFKKVLEHFMAFLQIPQHNILAFHEDKLSTSEKQIVYIITWKPHMQSQQTYSQKRLKLW